MPQLFKRKASTEDAAIKRITDWIEDHPDSNLPTKSPKRLAHILSVDHEQITEQVQLRSAPTIAPSKEQQTATVITVGEVEAMAAISTDETHLRAIMEKMVKLRRTLGN